MHKMSRRFIAFTAALALTVVACGDPTGVDSGDTLTSAEVAAVLAALGSAFESAPVNAPQAGPAQAPIPVNESFDVSVSCESGSIDVSGSIVGTFDDVTFDTDVRTNVRWDPNACVVGDGVNTFTLEGAPYIDLVLDLSSTGDLVTVSGTETGGFSYTSSDQRTGTCLLNVTFSIVTDATSLDVTVTGTICGLDASTFETLGT